MYLQHERNVDKHHLLKHLAMRAVGGGSSKKELDDEQLSISRENGYRNYINEYAAKYYRGDEEKAIADIKSILCQSFDSKQMMVSVSPEVRQYRVFLGDTNFEKAMKVTSEVYIYMLEKKLKHNICSVNLDKSNFLIKIGVEKPSTDEIRKIRQNEDAAVENFFESRSLKQIIEFKERIVKTTSYYRDALYYRIGLDKFNSQGFEDSYSESLTMIAYFIRKFMGHETEFKMAGGKMVGALNEIVLDESDDVLLRMKEAEINTNPLVMDSKKIENVIRKYSQRTDECFPTYTCTLLKDKEFPEEIVEVQKLLYAASEKVRKVDEKTRRSPLLQWNKNREFVMLWINNVQKIIDNCRRGRMGYKTGEQRRHWGSELSNLLKFIRNHEDFVSKSSNALLKRLTIERD